MKVERIAILAAWIAASPVALTDGVVSSVVKAPITPDGDVARAPTDLVIDLDTSLDPAFPGRALPAGCSVRLTLHEAFESTGLPVQDVFTPGCAPGAPFECTTGVLLQGWPQHPILPHAPVVPLGPATEYDLTSEGTHTLVFTALNDLMVPNLRPAPGPGIKQIHLINGFNNPRHAGLYPVRVEFGAGEGCTAESGIAKVRILKQIKPSVHITSAFNMGAPNTIYQVAEAGMPAPFAWDLLLWDRRGLPLEGVKVRMVGPDFALLKWRRRTIGHIRIHAPAGAAGHSVAGGPSVLVNAPVKGLPAGLLTVQFTAGSAPGSYTTQVSMRRGNSLSMFVVVP